MDEYMRVGKWKYLVGQERLIHKWLLRILRCLLRRHRHQRQQPQRDLFSIGYALGLGRRLSAFRTDGTPWQSRFESLLSSPSFFVTFRSNSTENQSSLHSCFKSQWSSGAILNPRPPRANLFHSLNPTKRYVAFDLKGLVPSYPISRCSTLPISTSLFVKFIVLFLVWEKQSYFYYRKSVRTRERIG